MKSTLRVGQKLYWVPYQRHDMEEQEVTVEKVGRKWATIANGRYRIDIQTLRADGRGYVSPGTCYPDKEAVLAERAASRQWNIMQQRMGHIPPQGVTIADIRQAMQLLKVPDL